MAADYILHHSRRESDRNVTIGNPLQDNDTQGDTRKKVITGAIIMLVGILVGFALARNNSDNL